LIAFWNLSKSQPMFSIASLIAAAYASADICRHAGAGAATAAIHAYPVAQRMLGGEALPRWWRIMDGLARQAPESVEAAASRMGQILAACSVEGFGNFVGAGLKAASGDKARRLKFFHARR
jgi:nitric oxide reductase NorD protein